VKALVDEPIELLEMGGRPLAMTRPVIRVPVTPGVVLTKQVATSAPLVLERSDFSEILILRGTHPSDPVFPWLEHFSREMAAQANRVSVRVRTIDVRTEAELAEALHRFRGAMMAIDAHGMHVGGEFGQVEFGDQTLTMHGVAFALPPIVFLASCETHAIHRGERTVAAALLNAGARCVIGTMASISAQSAALLFSDLIARATQSQPRYGSLVRWSEMFAASLWVCHAMEAVTTLVEAGVFDLSPQQVGEFADRLEASLVTFHPDWFEVACRTLESMTGIDAKNVKEEWLCRASVTDFSMFCQLGQADTILVQPLPM
jgi:hypothetical protein